MTKRPLLISTALLLAACQVDSSNEAASADANAVAPPAPLAPAVPAPPVSEQAPPAPAPEAPTPADAKSPAAAVAVLQAYCDAVATRDYPRAYGLWSGKGEASGMSEQAFADSFAKYAAYDCQIGKPGSMEGAAGSSYIEIPLTVLGALTKGGGFRLVGPVTLRRVNDVPGSTAEQRLWRITSSGLKPRP